MSVLFPKGSEWRRWDLHIHTPESCLSRGFAGWPSYLNALEMASPEIAAIGVTDYASIDGYKKLIAERSDNQRVNNFALILPNIEFRVSPETKRGAGINLHVIVDSLDPNHVSHIEDALSRLTFSYRNQPFPCTPAGLESLGKAHNETLIDSAARKEGCNQFKPSFDDFRKWYEAEGWLRRNSLIAVSNKSNDGVSGLSHDDGFRATRENIYRLADIVFSADPNDRSYFLGDAADSQDVLQTRIAGRKPCIHGSDAHEESKLFKPDQDRFCWIKGDPTFEGLRQICYEPRIRVHIGPSIPSQPDKHQLLESITVSDSHGWFPSATLALNSGLVTVIGSKGSGKTAFADLIAYAANAWESTPTSFLNKARSELVGTTIRLRWSAGEDVQKQITAQLESKGERRVTYLSQHFVEHLCSEDRIGLELTEEIERVIFNYLDETDRLGHASFADLRESSTASLVERRNRIRTAIFRLNIEIQALDEEIATRPTKAKSLLDLKAEKEGLQEQMPSFSSDEEKQVNEELSNLREEQAKRLELITDRKRLIQDIGDIRERVSAFLEDMKEFSAALSRDLDKIGLKEKLRANFEPVYKGDISEPLDARERELGDEVNELTGEDTDRLPESKTLKAIVFKIGELEQRSTSDGEKKQKILAIQQRSAAIDKSLQSISNSIIEIDKQKLPLRMAKQEERLQKLKLLFNTLSEEEVTLNRLYAPLGKRFAEGTGDETRLEFYLQKVVDLRTWAKTGEELVDQRKRGPYRASDDLAVKATELLEVPLHSNNPDELVDALSRLRATFEGPNDDFTLASQLRDEVEMRMFDDWLYSLDHVAVAYGIKFDGTELANLSPGTKGIVLLILYLEMDTEDRQPLLIDQPEENLDNESVYKVLTAYFRRAKRRRQIILITHNPNLVVNADSDQIIIARYRKTVSAGESRIAYQTGSLEDSCPSEPFGVRECVCEILEGGKVAFQKREEKYSFTARHG